MNSLKVLISVYACEPGKGSEPGVGWNVVLQMAKRHEVWAITRANNRSIIEDELKRTHIPNLHFVYFDLPGWIRGWKKGRRGIRLYYYLWQIGIYFVARRLHKQVGFDLAHHVTFVKYWTPCFLSIMPFPFIWGPVGGGESAPQSFWHDLSLRGRLFEISRYFFRALCELDPSVRMTARNSSIALVTTEESSARLGKFLPKRMLRLGESGLTQTELHTLGKVPFHNGPTIRFISMGRLLSLKGFHLGLRAFAGAAIPDAEYWILGDGPERTNLKDLAAQLKISHRVHFFGSLPRNKALEKLGECHTLVHPSLHDSGGWVCLEAMAAGRPVVCLDLGGPATQVTKDTGFKIPAITPNQVVADMAKAMIQLAKDPFLREQMGKAGRELVAREHSWDRKGEILHRLYAEATGVKKTVNVINGF